MSSKQSRQVGFTLMELMISILLIVGAVAAATFMMGRGMFAATGTETFQQAVALAQERMENLRGATFASIVSKLRAPVSGWTGFDRKVDVSQPAGTNSDFKQVAVTVYWSTVDGELSTSLTSTVANVVNN